MRKVYNIIYYDISDQINDYIGSKIWWKVYWKIPNKIIKLIEIDIFLFVDNQIADNLKRIKHV